MEKVCLENLLIVQKSKEVEARSLKFTTSPSCI